MDELALIVKYFYLQVLCKSTRPIAWRVLHIICSLSSHPLSETNGRSRSHSDRCHEWKTQVSALKTSTNRTEECVVLSFSFDPLFTSGILTSIIEDLILPSSFAEEYLASVPVDMGDIKLSLPAVRNSHLEHEMLNNHDPRLMINPFSNASELADFLTRCERKLDHR